MINFVLNKFDKFDEFDEINFYRKLRKLAFGYITTAEVRLCWIETYTDGGILSFMRAANVNNYYECSDTFDGNKGKLRAEGEEYLKNCVELINNFCKKNNLSYTANKNLKRIFKSGTDKKRKRQLYDAVVKIDLKNINPDDYAFYKSAYQNIGCWDDEFYSRAKSNPVIDKFIEKTEKIEKTKETEEKDGFEIRRDCFICRENKMLYEDHQLKPLDTPGQRIALAVAVAEKSQETKYPAAIWRYEIDAGRDEKSAIVSFYRKPVKKATPLPPPELNDW
jgi:DNA-directed RNA polymerase subunit M/transcription elongation factor TFIIS